MSEWGILLVLFAAGALLLGVGVAIGSGGA